MPTIWRLKMPTSQRLAVSAICSLAFITIAFETVRCVKLWQLDSHLTNLYSYTELLVSVIVGMLPSYRFMVGPSDKDHEYRRIFWSTVTFRSIHSNSSGFSMATYERDSRRSGSSRNAGVPRGGSQENVPVPAVPHWATNPAQQEVHAAESSPV